METPLRDIARKHDNHRPVFHKIIISQKNKNERTHFKGLFAGHSYGNYLLGSPLLHSRNIISDLTLVSPNLSLSPDCSLLTRVSSAVDGDGLGQKTTMSNFDFVHGGFRGLWNEAVRNEAEANEVEILDDEWKEGNPKIELGDLLEEEREANGQY